MNVLIIGGNGFVGGHLVQCARKLGFAAAIADTQDEPALPGVPYFKCDVTDRAGIGRIFNDFQPDLAVNVAAVADIDKAEQNHALAERVNVAGAANAAFAAASAGSKYCWFSSDAVFSGSGCDYDERSVPAPVNFYGMTKKQGEAAVLAADPSAIVPRISLVLGFPVKQGNSYLAGLAQKLLAGQEVPVSDREIRTPIDVLTLSEAVFDLFESGFAGIIHLGATSSVSRYGLASLLACKMGADPARVRRAGPPDPSRAPRHQNGIICVDLAARTLKRTRLLTVEETADRALTTRTN